MNSTLEAINGKKSYKFHLQLTITEKHLSQNS